MQIDLGISRLSRTAFSAAVLAVALSASCSRESGTPLTPASLNAAPEGSSIDAGTPVGRVFSRFALVIDDARLDGAVSDADHDAYLRDVFLPRLYELGQVDHVQLFGTDSSNEDRDLDAAAVPLFTMLLYKNVIWSCDELPMTRKAGLFVNQHLSDALRRYVERGGHLLIFGNDVATTLTGSASNGNAYFPKPDPNELEGGVPFFGYELNSFLYRDLGARGSIVSIPTEGPVEQRAASGLIGAEPILAGWPSLQLDVSKWDPSELLDCDSEPQLCHLRGGMSGWEGTAEPLSGSDPTELLYRARTWNTYYDPTEGESREVLAAVDHAALVRRWILPLGSAPGGRAGRVAWIGFQPWFFEPAGVAELGRRMVDWLVVEGDGAAL